MNNNNDTASINDAAEKFNELLGEKIDWANYKQLAEDVWLFLTNDKLPNKATIKKEPFLHEVAAMIDNAVLFNTQPLQLNKQVVKARYNFEQGLRDIFGDAGNYDYKGLPHTQVMINEILNLYDKTQSTPTISLSDDGWIDVKDRLPEKDTRIVIAMDYSKWGRNEIRIEIANVHLAETPQRYGGPNSLTGSGYIEEGIYFSIPAIINPRCVTHWQPLPKPPSAALQQKSVDKK